MRTANAEKTEPSHAGPIPANRRPESGVIFHLQQQDHIKRDHAVSQELGKQRQCGFLRDVDPTHVRISKSARPKDDGQLPNENHSKSERSDAQHVPSAPDRVFASAGRSWQWRLNRRG